MLNQFKLHYKILAILLSSILIAFSCKNNKAIDNNQYTNLEKLRKIAINQMLEEAGNPNSLTEIFLKLKYEIPDNIIIPDIKQKYIKENIELPNFIKKAIIVGYPIELMTIGEFFIVKQEEMDEISICPSTLNPNEIILGYRKYYNNEKHIIQHGPYWLFKNGFLWEYGEI